VILLPQISDKENFEDRKEIFHFGSQTKLYISILDLDLFPGPHSAKNEELDQTELAFIKKLIKNLFDWKQLFPKQVVDPCW
jgi:hypothetical protein